MEFTQGVRFDSLGLTEEVQRALKKKNIEESTPVQAGCIPPMREWKDVIAKAPTGTGKTFAFGIPIIEHIEPGSEETEAVILAPTRELAMQITAELRDLCVYLPGVRIVCLYGGAPIGKQIDALKKHPQIVVATPGRLSDHMKRRTVKLDNVKTVVLDEADRMLDMGFIHDVTRILDKLASRRNLGMFSATISREVMDISWMYQRDPEEITVQAKEENKPDIAQYRIDVGQNDKAHVMAQIIRAEGHERVMAFCNTKGMTERLKAFLMMEGLEADCIHGDIPQKKREAVMARFRRGELPIFVATDVAARGIDVDDVDAVFNYDVPLENEYYVHRIGRTGRAGNQGTAITFISGAELRRFNWMMRDIKADIKRETLPSPQDIVAMKRAKIKDDLQEIVANESYGDYADIAAELLESYAPDVALGALLRLAFRSELDQSNYPEIRSFSVDRKGKARLFLALGGRDGYTARRIVEMLKRKCGLRDKNIDDVRVFENYSLVSVPFSDAEAVVGQLNASGGRRRIAKIDGSDAENGGGKRRRPATEGRNGGEGASGSESAGEPRSETRGRRKAGQPEGAEEFRSERRPRRETAETADDAGERRSVTRSRKKAENDWNASPAGGNDGFDWEAFQRYDDAAAWEKPKRGGGTRSVRRSGRPVTTGRQAAPKRIAAKGRKR